MNTAAPQPTSAEHNDALPQSTETPVDATTAKPIQIEDALKRIGAVNVGIVTCASVIYLLGYCVWACHAWRSNLGLLPALQFQYFVAGLLLLAVVGLSFLTVYFGKGVDAVGSKLSHRITDFVEKRTARKSLRSTMHSIMTGAVFFAFAIGGAVLNRHFAPTAAMGKTFWAIWLYLCACLLWGLWYPRQFESLLKTTTTTPKDKTVNVVYEFIRLIATQTWTVAAVLIVPFLNGGYASIPHEFGGAKPRLAYFDVKRADVSAETRTEFLPAKMRDLPTDSSKDPSAVARSIIVDVYYTSSDFYLVRPHRAKVETPVTQVKKETVQGVRWLGYSEPTPLAVVSSPSPKKRTRPLRSTH